MRALRILVAGATLSALLPARTAFAAPETPEAEGDAVEKAAKARYAEGVRLYAKGRYEEARVEFTQALALKNRANVRLMLGLASAKSGHWLDALRDLDIATTEGDLTAKQRELVEAARREARSHVGRLRFDIPEGSDVTIDDQPATKTRDLVDVTAGKHVVVVKRRDETKTVNVDVAAGAIFDVKPTFVGTTGVPQTETRTRPTLPPAPEAGSHGGPSLLSPPETAWPVYVLGAVGLGGLTAAAIYGGLGANANHAVDVTTQALLRTGKTTATCDAPTVEPKYADVCASYTKNKRLADSDQNAFAISAIVGISATALAFGWFFFAPKDRGDKTSATHVLPWIGTAGAGATASGSF